jgi:hypothetical protein
MPSPTPAYIDRDTSELYYLAFNVMLARAPIRGDTRTFDEGGLARRAPDYLVSRARHASIRGGPARCLSQ